MIRDVLLCGNQSKNGYSIPPSAFGSEARVKRLYEGVPIYFDHGDVAKKGPFSRSSSSIAGVIRNVRLVDGKPRGDIEPMDSEQGRLLASTIKASPRNHGLSHVARYDIDRKAKVVKSVEEVFSVDVVINPATTKTFRENVSCENRMTHEFDTADALGNLVMV